jgi:hypothetical protein
LRNKLEFTSSIDANIAVGKKLHETAVPNLGRHNFIVDVSTPLLSMLALAVGP